MKVTLTRPFLVVFYKKKVSNSALLPFLHEAAKCVCPRIAAAPVQKIVHVTSEERPKRSKDTIDSEHYD